MSKNIIQKSTALGAIISLLFNGIKQAIEINDGEKDEFDWSDFFNSIAKGAAIGFGVGIIIDQVEKSQEGEPEFRETRYLRSVLRSHDPKITSEFEFQKRKGEEITAAIQEEYDQFIFKPEISGSLGKGTGLSGSDLDIVVPYKKYAFNKIEDMFEDTHSFLKDYAAGDREISRVIRQGKSIGLECRSGEITTNIDIVPGKERKNYKIDKDLSLHVRGNFWSSNATYTKTNIHKQKAVLKGSPSKKEVIQLFKIWKNANGVKVSSYELEMLVDRAFEAQSGRMPHTLYSKLITTATFMHENLDTISLRDAGAKSKTLLDDESKRSQVQRKIGTMLGDLIADSRNLPDYFPENHE